MMDKAGNAKAKMLTGLTVLLLTGSLLAGCTRPEPVATKTTCGAGMTTESVLAGSVGSPAAPERAIRLRAGDVGAAQENLTLTVKLGTLMPLTGALAPYGPDMQRGADLAAAEINNATAAGVTVKVELIHEDDRSTDTTQAPNTFNRLADQGVSAVIGGAASSITLAILDLAVQNRVLVVTPASTSALLSVDRDNKGFFWRVPPSDELQAKVLSGLVADDGCGSVSVLAVNNPYGKGFGIAFAKAFETGGGDVATQQYYPEETKVVTSEVDKAVQGTPDAVVVIGYPGEGALIMKEAYRRGALADSVFFFSEGLKTEAFVTSTGKDEQGRFLLAGLRGTAPEGFGAPGAERFKAAFNATYGHEAGLFAAESYDGVYTSVLAAVCAGSAEGEEMKADMRAVANADPGDVQVTGADVAAALGAAMLDCRIDYAGASGDLDWDEKGDPIGGTYSVWRVTDDGKIETEESGVEA